MRNPTSIRRCASGLSKALGMLFVAALGLGCDAILGSKLNPAYCEAHPEDVDCKLVYPDAKRGCSANADCAAPLGVCDLAQMMCVQCTSSEPNACVGDAPVCGSDSACRTCVAHSECGSSACLPDGSCGTDINVAYVDPAGTGTTCTKLAPCKKVDDALKTQRPFVKLRGTTIEQVTINNQNVTLLADPGAKLTDTNVGILLRIDGTSIVSIYDLEITGAAGANNPGLSLQPGNTASVSLTRAKVTANAGTGISATNGTLTVSQSTISGNIGGGISVIDGTFIIVGNVFLLNGTPTSRVGGINVQSPESLLNRLELNTFNQNQARNGSGPAIDCDAGMFTAKYNIMSVNGTLTQMDQVAGPCMHAYSIARPGVVPAGTGNSSADPLFVNSVDGDLHLQAGSPARGAAVGATLTGIAAHDIDGDARVAPADIGADQVRP